MGGTAPGSRQQHLDDRPGGWCNMRPPIALFGLLALPLAEGIGQFYGVKNQTCMADWSKVTPVSLPANQSWTALERN